MDIDKLFTLDQDSLKEGIKSYRDNAIELINAGDILATNQKYGSALALTVLSIEELIKGYSIFLLLTGLAKRETIEPIFKGTVKYNKVHQLRLRYALALNQLLSQMDLSKFDSNVISQLDEKDFQPKTEIKTEADLDDWIEDTIDKLIPLISISDFGISSEIYEEIDKEIADPSNWFVQAKTEKEKGLYVDYESNRWISPSVLTEQKYLNAKNNSSKLHEMLLPILDLFSGQKSVKAKFALAFTRKFVHSTIK